MTSECGVVTVTTDPQEQPDGGGDTPSIPGDPQQPDTPGGSEGDAPKLPVIGPLSPDNPRALAAGGIGLALLIGGS